MASQFNVLEMVSPDVGPEAVMCHVTCMRMAAARNALHAQGITGYQHDHTQGPACAMSCPAATVFRCVCVSLQVLAFVYVYVYKCVCSSLMQELLCQRYRPGRS